MNKPTEIQGVSGTQLKLFVEKIERLEEEKSEVQENIKDVYAEAKSVGFDTKVMKQVVRLRKLKKEEYEEQEELLDIYKQALGMIPSESN